MHIFDYSTVFNSHNGENSTASSSSDSSGATPDLENGLISQPATATTPDLEDGLVPQLTTATKPGLENGPMCQSNTTRTSVCTEIICQILSEFITEDSLIEIVGRWDDSMARTIRRRDVCPILLASRTLYAEASKLIRERSSIEVYLPVLPRCGRIGSPGLWSTFHTVHIYLRSGHGNHIDNSIYTLTSLWGSFRYTIRTTQGDRGSWHQVKVIFYEPDHVLASPSADLKLWSSMSEVNREILQDILKTLAWASVLTFDNQLRFVSSRTPILSQFDGGFYRSRRNRYTMKPGAATARVG
jgi:hypothetical protein